MSTERDHILKMLEGGAITAGEAAELLGALEDNESVTASGAASRDVLPVPNHGDPPWEAPFFGGLVIAGFGLLGLLRARRAGILARIGAWVTLLLGLTAIVAGYWSRNAPWLHINVQERNGNDIHLSLPLLLPLAQRLLDVARGFADAETAVQLDHASAFFDALQRGEQHDPLSIEINDDDGGRVLVYVA